MIPSASLGLVAALAWNEAIRTTIRVVFGTGDTLAGLSTYANLASVLTVVVLTWPARVASRVGGDAVIAREAEG